MRRNTGKVCLGIVLILLSIYAAAMNPLISKVFASNPFPTNRPVLFTSPDVIQQDIGVDFTVSVKIFNLTNNVWTDPLTMKLYPLGNLYAVGLNMSWDPTILEYVTHVVKIPVDDYPDGVLYAPTTSFTDDLNTASGYYKMAYSSMSPAPPFNNPDQNSTVFEITFRAKKGGACALKLTQVQLSGREPGDRIYHEGYVVGEGSWGRGAVFSTPGAPVAKFSIWPADLRPGLNKPVMFNASESYDPDGTITDYMWDFGDGSTGSGANPIIYHTYTSIGDYKVGLKVRDNDSFESLRFEQTLRVVEKRDVMVRSIDIADYPVVHGAVTAINITVSSNSGADTPESFKVSAYYNSTPAGGWVLIGTQSVVDLTTDERLTFSWDTGGTPIPPGGASYFYSVLANATYVPQEANITNNSMKSLSLIEMPGGDIYDVSATALSVAVEVGGQTFNSPFILGEKATVRFQVKNFGTTNEMCNITLRFVAANGTQLLPPKEWKGELIEYANQKPYNFSNIDLPATTFNVTVKVDIAEVDRNPENNNGRDEVRVVKPPKIEIQYPANIGKDQSATFDATASHHQDPEGQITTYTWDVRPEGEVAGNIKEGVSVAYSFSSTGNWTVRLRIKDNFGLTFDPSQNRPGASAYVKELTINVQGSSAGGSQFPIDPIYIIAAIVIIAIVAVVALRILRKPKPEP